MHEMSSYTRPSEIGNTNYPKSSKVTLKISKALLRTVQDVLKYTVHKINLLVSQVHEGRNILYHMKANKPRIALINSNTNKKTINPHKNNR